MRESLHVETVMLKGLGHPYIMYVCVCSQMHRMYMYVCMFLASSSLDKSSGLISSVSVNVWNFSYEKMFLTFSHTHSLSVGPSLPVCLS